MILLGIIGTNWISRDFVKAALTSEKYRLNAVYSRKEETAQAFAANFKEEKVTCYSDLDTFLANDQMEMVYIASPNSLHFQQAKAAILAGKSVIVEKPAFSTPREFAEIRSLAEEKEVYFFEAARHIYEANFLKVKELLPPISEIRGANFTYSKYSSRYDAVLAGEESNIFSPKFAGGALMDLGVYLLYAAIEWFGEPQTQHYFIQKISTGVDGMGTIILRYPHFDVTLSTGKIIDSFLPSEIYTTSGTISLSSVNNINKIEVYERKNNTKKIIANKGETMPMESEVVAFADFYHYPEKPAQNMQYQKVLDTAEIVNELMCQLRKEAGITFASDPKNE